MQEEETQGLSHLMGPPQQGPSGASQCRLFLRATRGPSSSQLQSSSSSSSSSCSSISSSSNSISEGQTKPRRRGKLSPRGAPSKRGGPEDKGAPGDRGPRSPQGAPGHRGPPEVEGAPGDEGPPEVGGPPVPSGEGIECTRSRRHRQSPKSRDCFRVAPSARSPWGGDSTQRGDSLLPEGDSLQKGDSLLYKGDSLQRGDCMQRGDSLLPQGDSSQRRDNILVNGDSSGRGGNLLLPQGDRPQRGDSLPSRGDSLQRGDSLLSGEDSCPQGGDSLQGGDSNLHKGDSQGGDSLQEGDSLLFKGDSLRRGEGVPPSGRRGDSLLASPRRGDSLLRPLCLHESAASASDSGGTGDSSAEGDLAQRVASRLRRLSMRLRKIEQQETTGVSPRRLFAPLSPRCASATSRRDTQAGGDTSTTTTDSRYGLSALAHCLDELFEEASLAAAQVLLYCLLSPSRRHPLIPSLPPAHNTPAINSL